MRRLGVRGWLAMLVALATVTFGLTALESAPSGAVDGVIPPIFGNTSIGLVDSTVPQAIKDFETAATTSVMKDKHLDVNDQTQRAAVRGWARNEIAAQAWVDLVAIIKKAPANRTASETAVYNWFRDRYQARRIAEAQGAVDEFRRWSGMTEKEMYDPDHPTVKSPDPLQATYCAYQPPGGATGPFAGTYSVAYDMNCKAGGCINFAGCPINYPSVEQWKQWGTYTVAQQDVAKPAFVNRAAGITQAVLGGLAVAASVGITAFGAAVGAGIAAGVTAATVFPYAAAGAAAAIALGAVANVIGTVIVAAVVIGIAVYQREANQKISVTLIKDRDASKTTVPDLASEINSTAGYQNIYTTFLLSTLPDVDYGCTGTAIPGQPPCANAPAPVAANSATDPRFLVLEQKPTGLTIGIKSTIYGSSGLDRDTALVTRPSGDGWFVSTSYDTTKPANVTAPTTPSVAAESTALPVAQSLKLGFADWDGKKWIAQRTRDNSGNEAFAITPLDKTGGGSCASPVMNTTSNNCVTKVIAFREPDGTKAQAQIVPASAVLPKVTAQVPPVVEGGSTIRLSASASSQLSPGPYTYLWQLNGGVGIAGQSVDLTFPPGPGVYTLAVTATDQSNPTLRSTITMPVQVMAKTFVDVLTASTTPAAGEPVTFVARVGRVGCVFFSTAENCARTMTGKVQFYVDDVPAGPPVDLAGVTGSRACPVLAACGSIISVMSGYAVLPPVTTLTRTSQAIVDSNGLPIGQTLTGPGHVVTATYFGDSNFLGSSGGLAEQETTQQGDAPGAPRPPLQVGWATPTVNFDPPAYPGAGWDQPVPLHAKVTPPAGTGLIPTGSVGFAVNGTPVGTPATIDANGDATLNVPLPAPAPGAAPYQFTAKYSGDEAFFGKSASQTTAATAPRLGSTPYQATLTSLTDPIVVPFSRPVMGVTGAHVLFQRLDTSAKVGAKLTCRNAANASVSCSKGPVSSLVLTPTAPLVPNLPYGIIVANNNTTTPILAGYPDAIPMATDGVQRIAPAASDAFGPALAYQWGIGKKTGALGGSYRQEAFPGATASFKGSGTSLGIITWNGPDGGLANVKVTASNGTVSTRTIDTYAATAGDVTTTITGLPPKGQHTVVITVPGTKSAASTGTWVRLDGTVINGVTANSPGFIPAKWGNFPGQYQYTGTTSATVKFAFYGTALDWTAFAGPNNGKVKVVIDGTVVAAAEDLYAAAFGNKTFHYGGLANKVHTVVITTLGTRNAASTDVISTFRGFTAS